MKKVALTLLVVCGATASAFADGTLTGRVTDLSDQPVKDASVFVSGPDGLEATVTTDPTGRYIATVKVGGPKAVIFAFGNKRIGVKVTIPDNTAVTLDQTLEMGGEIIEVVDLPKPLQYPKLKGDPLAIPTYSETAVMNDVWTKAWFLLDVDDHGVVQRVKFLVRPGSDLDVIAVKYAFNLRFTPARDRHGVPQQSYIVWSLEWPSYTWMQNGEHPMGRLPDLGLDGVQVGYGVLPPTYPPCGKGGPNRPMNFGMLHTGLRDCTVPDMSKSDASEPWIHRDASIPAPVVAPTERIDPVKLRDEMHAKKRNLYIAATSASVATALAVVGMVYSWAQFSKYQGRVDDDMGQHTGLLPPDQLKNDQARVNDWEVRTFPFAIAAVLGGMGTAYLWHKSFTTLSVQPAGEGATVSLSGRF